MKLDSSEVVFHSRSGLDWSGRVFWWKGGLYRAIRSERVPFYKHLLSAGIIRDLVQRRLLIDSEATDLELDGYGLVLKHRTLPFVSYCYEWCGEMLKAAALSVLQLEKELRNHGLALVDLHPRNVLFDGTTPVWVDLGALVPASQGQSWNGFDEFELFSAHFTRPLKIMAAGHPRVARCLLRDGYPGVQQREVQTITETASAEMIRIAKTGAKAVARNVIPAPFRPFVRRTVQHLARPTSSESAWGPISSVRSADKDIEKIRLVQLSTESSGDYGDAGFPDFTPTTDWTEKHRSILSILSAKRPDSVLDIRPNRGWHSQLAARNGAQVVSVDFDEATVTKLFFDAMAAKLPILPLIVDFHKTGPGTPMAAAPGLAPAERLRCDMVFALAPVHDLLFGHFINLEQLISGLSAFAQKWLVIEFVGPDDEYVKQWIDPRLRWYSLDHLLTAVNKEFRKIDLFPSSMEHRRILLCER
jgi:hypothetical protein